MIDVNTSVPLVSVVIATYNMGQYLAQAIDSILQQAWSNIEIIVVDDGSEDNTASVMLRYEGEPKVIYIKNDNQGQPKAKNCGINNSTGDFIAFCDADDRWAHNKLEMQMPLFDNPKVGVVYSDVGVIDENDKHIVYNAPFYRRSGKITDYLLINNIVPFGTAVIRRACIEKNGIFNEEYRMGIDWDLWLRYSLDWEFSYIPEPIYFYRKWSGQMSRNIRGRYEHSFRILRDFIQKYGHKLDPRKVQEAWACMYISQANAIAVNEKKFYEPLKGILIGLKMNPAYWIGWKSLAKLLLRKH